MSKICEGDLNGHDNRIKHTWGIPTITSNKFSKDKQRFIATEKIKECSLKKDLKMKIILPTSKL